MQLRITLATDYSIIHPLTHSTKTVFLDCRMKYLIALCCNKQLSGFVWVLEILGNA